MSGTDAQQASTANTILHDGDPRWFHGEYRRPNDVDAVFAAMHDIRPMTEPPAGRAELTDLSAYSQFPASAHADER
jgi:hypothetical protein